METEKLLIRKVRENRKILIDDEVKDESKEQFNEVWCQIAKDCTLENAEVAETKWKQMLNDYMKFLRTGDTFPHAHDMSFMQQHLISFKKSSSDDLTPGELDQLRLLFANDGGGGGKKEGFAAEKQSNNVNMSINIKETPAPDSIIANHSESILPVPELVPAPIIESVVKEQNINVVTPSKEDCIMKTRSPLKLIAKSGPVRVVLIPKSSNGNSHSKMTHIRRVTTSPQQQPVAVIPSSGQELPVNSQLTTIQPCHEATFMHAADPLQLPQQQQQQPVTVFLSSGQESADNNQPTTIQSWHEAAVVHANDPLQLQQQQQQQPVAGPSSSAPISVAHNEPSGAQYKDLTPLELIFLGYAKTLQKMPPALRMQTKRKISEILDEAELQLCE